MTSEEVPKDLLPLSVAIVYQLVDIIVDAKKLEHQYPHALKGEYRGS